MRYFVAAALVAFAVTAPPVVDAAEDCSNADRSQVLFGVRGDFEVVIDPQDTAGNLIYVSNMSDGTSTVVAARISGLTGTVLNGSLTTIANNFRGLTSINGPEFVQKPNGELGIVYAGSEGVHGVFRPAQPAVWNDFRFDVTGAPTRGRPPALPATSAGAYPAAPLPPGQSTYAQWRGSCLGLCYAALDGDISTDVFTLEAQGLTVSASTNSPRDGYVFVSACDGTNSCGLYEVKIDNAGGFVSGSLQKFASLSGSTFKDSLVSVRHPVTGSTIVFSNKGASGTAIDVWEQPEEGGALSLIASVPVTSSGHFRAVSSTTAIVLHHLIRTGTSGGSYTIPVTATESGLTVGANKKISAVSGGSEFAWLPAARRWALFFNRPTNNIFTRCWVIP